MTDDEKKKPSFFQRFTSGLTKTRQSLGEKICTLLPGKSVLKEGTLDEIEEALISADIGHELAEGIIAELKKKTKWQEEPGAFETAALMRGIVESRFLSRDRSIQATNKPHVILLVGINGSGKTTTAGKLAKKFADEGKKVIIGAGDTFRAAAIEQLAVWAERAGADIVRHADGSDPAAVLFDTLQAAQARGHDVVLLDTAGRLHAKSNLMEELKKIGRVIDKALPGAPHETLIVLDGTIGQNAIPQAKTFNEAIPLTGIVITKLDGTAKGGAVIEVERSLGVPVKLVGVGEQAEDLLPFSPRDFSAALF